MPAPKVTFVGRKKENAGASTAEAQRGKSVDASAVLAPLLAKRAAERVKDAVSQAVPKRESSAPKVTFVGTPKETAASRVSERDDGAVRARYAQRHPEETGGEWGAIVRGLNSARVQGDVAALNDYVNQYKAYTAPEAIQGRIDAMTAQVNKLETERKAISPKPGVQVPAGAYAEREIATATGGLPYAAARGAVSVPNGERLRSIDKEIETLQQKIARETATKTYMSYEALREAPDFEKKSVYRRNRGEAVGWAPILGAVSLSGGGPVTGFVDPVYDSVNGDSEAIRRGKRYAGLVYEDVPADVAKLFNYIYETQGKEAAHRYIEFMMDPYYSVVHSGLRGAVDGSGITSLGKAVIAGVGLIPGMKQEAKDSIERLDLGQQQAARQHPVAYGVGNVGGAVGTSVAIGTALGGAPAIAGLGQAGKAAATGAGTMGTMAALQGAGDVATGRRSFLDLAEDVVISSAAGGAGGAASSWVSGMGSAAMKSGAMKSGAVKAALGKGVKDNVVANVLNQGAAGAAFSGASMGTRKLLDPDYAPTKEEVLQELATTFLFSTISSAIHMHAKTKAAKAQLDYDLAATKSNYANIVLQEKAGQMPTEAALDALEQETAQLRSRLNNTQYVGHGKEVQEALTVLNMIDDNIAATRQRIGGGSTAVQSGGLSVPGGLALPPAVSVAAPGGSMPSGVALGALEGRTTADGGVDTPTGDLALNREKSGIAGGEVSPVVMPLIDAQNSNQGKTPVSAQATAVMERLSKGEEVSLDEIYQIPEVAEVEAREHADTSKVNTPERQKLRRDVLAQLQALGSYTGFDKNGDGGYNGPVRQERRADIVIGVPAAGKSSVLVNPLSREYGSRVIDSDMAKELLPEYDGGKGASDVHRESSRIRDDLLDATVDSGDNLVWPQVGGKLEDLRADILWLKSEGYQVYLHLNELPAGKATGRAINRFLTEGRYVDPGIVMGVGDAPTRNYEILRKEGGLLDGYSRYSNDVARGDLPRLLERSEDDGGRTGRTDPRLLESSEGGAGTAPPVAGDASGGADRRRLRVGRGDGVGRAAQTGRTQGAGGAGASVGAAARGFAGAYDRLQGETPASGFYPDGENAYRQVDVPMRDFDGRAIPKSAATVMEAQAAPDAALGQIQEMIASGALSFDSITDKSALRRAEGEIRNTGYQKALGAWLEQTRRGVTSKDLVVKGQVLLNSAMNSRATEDVVQILSAYTRLSTRAAQAMQAQRVLKKLSPEWRLYAVQQSIASYQEELNARLGKDAPTITVAPDLYDAYLAASDPQEREAALMDIYQNVADQIPATFAEKWNAWRYLSMLGNPRTHIRNIVGNAGFAPVRGVKNAIAWGMENGVDIANKAAGGMGIEKTKAMIVPLLSRLNAQDGALVSACYQDLANVEEQLLGAGKYAQSTQGQIDQRRTIFKTKALEAVRKANSAALDVEDTWFSRPVYAGALAGYLKAHKVTAQMLTDGTVKAETLDAARAYAVREAQKATYRDANAFSDLVARLGRLGEGKGKAGKAAHVLVEGVLPFKRTPANILARGVEYSPAGLVKGLTYDLVQVKNGNMTAAQAIDNISSGLTGTGLLALGFWLASMGLVTGGGGEEPEDKLRDLTGGQDYALTLPGGSSVTLDWLPPEALPFFVGVEAFNYAQDHTDGTVDWRAIESAAVQITDPVMEMSMLQGFQDAVNEVKFADDGLLLRLAANAGLSYLTQGVPTLFGQLERTAESERNSTYVDSQSGIPKEVQWMLGKVMNKLPGEFSQIPYIDAWGRREETGTALERAVNNLLNPAYGSVENKTPADKEIQRLLEAGQTGVVPKRPAQSVKIGKEYLSAEEYVAYAEAKGQLSYQLVSELISDGAYKAMSDADKAKAISDAYGYANAMAKKKVKPKYEIPSEYAKAKRMMDAGLSLGEWLAMRAGADADENERTSKDELVAYIDAHVPKGRRRAVFDAYKGKQKWKNPY